MCIDALWISTGSSVEWLHGSLVAKLNLRSQMRRASRSVPFNIGEGVGKRGRARAASYEIALGEAKELIVALDCVEIDEYAPIEEITAAQDLTDRVCAMLTKLIRSVEDQCRPIRASSS